MMNMAELADQFAGYVQLDRRLRAFTYKDDDNEAFVSVLGDGGGADVEFADDQIFCLLENGSVIYGFEIYPSELKMLARKLRDALS